MKVLVATTPGWGHVTPVLVVAEELVRRGHEVVWVTPRDAADRLTAEGFRVVAIGPELRERLPAASRLIEERASSADAGALRAHAFTVHFALLGAVATFESVFELVSDCSPDVIVREPGELASALAARALDVPLATVGFGGIVPEAARRMADEALAPILSRHGVVGESDGWHFGDLYLHPMPASMDVERVPTSTLRVRPEWAVGSSRSVPGGDLERFGEAGAVVYASFGTEFGPMAPWEPLLDALGDLGIDALVTTGASGLPADLAVPANVVVRDYVPQATVLARATAVVSHAGSGTLLGAAMAGVPQVCIPLGADQFENALAATTRGIAVTVGPPHRTAEHLAEAIGEATSSRAMASAAGEVAAEIALADDLPHAVDAIERLATNGAID